MQPIWKKCPVPCARTRTARNRNILSIWGGGGTNIQNHKPSANCPPTMPVANRSERAESFEFGKPVCCRRLVEVLSPLRAHAREIRAKEKVAKSTLLPHTVNRIVERPGHTGSGNLKNSGRDKGSEKRTLKGATNPLLSKTNSKPMVIHCNSLQTAESNQRKGRNLAEKN